VSGNWATGSDTGDGSSGFGGGVWVSAGFAPGSLTLVNTTVSSNTAVAGGGGVVAWYYDVYTPTARLQNSIIANNQAPAGAGCWNYQGDLVSQGYNLEDGDTCNLTQPTDLPDTDPLLGPLMDNGGPTWTHALPEDSPAVDAGSCPDTGADQRGYPRPFDHPNMPNADDGCDIGAYEVQDDNIGPSILATEPVSGAVNVALDAPVVITFDEAISMPTFVYSCDPDPGGWSASWSNLGTVVTLSHGAMMTLTTYSMTVHEAEDLAGNHLIDAPYEWTFETREEIIPPEIEATEPVSGAVDVALDAPVVIAFSEAINPATLSYSSNPDPGGWSAAWNGLGTVVTLTHETLLPGTVYTVTVTAAEDLAGNPLAGAPYGWWFMTVEEHWLYLPLVLK
jgi:hypothetical protein